MTEPLYPLHLTLAQLDDLKGILDAVSAGEGDPDALVFSTLDQVRDARRVAYLARGAAQAANSIQAATLVEIESVIRHP